MESSPPSDLRSCPAAHAQFRNLQNKLVAAYCIFVAEENTRSVCNLLQQGNELETVSSTGESLSGLFRSEYRFVDRTL